MADKKEIIYAFIDSQNLNLSIKHNISKKGRLLYSGWELDFNKFRIYLKDKYNVSKAFLFIGWIAGNEGLYHFLESSGYTMIYKPTLNYKDDKHQEQTKGNVDAELVLHAMIEFCTFDKAIIISGDGDYYCLIKYLQEQNKLLHVAIPNRHSYSSLLREFRSYFIYISDLKQKLEK